MAHCHSAHAHAVGVPAARLAGVPGVVVSRRVDFAIGGNPLSALKYRLPVDRYLCISRGVIDAMVRSGVARERLALVPSGVPLPSDGAGPARAAGSADLRALIGAAPGAAVIGTVAALAPHKNHADLARAAARVLAMKPDVQYAWVGEGECRPALEHQIAGGIGRSVHLLGFRDDARALLVQFTVFALSSYLKTWALRCSTRRRSASPWSRRRSAEFQAGEHDAPVCSRRPATPQPRPCSSIRSAIRRPPSGAQAARLTVPRIQRRCHGRAHVTGVRHRAARPVGR
jgi:glycosyltransferase involved in cell wall biosynthesis